MSSASARLSRLNPGGWARIRQHKWAKIHGHSHTWIRRCSEEWINGRYTRRQKTNAYCLLPTGWLGYQAPPEMPPPHPTVWGKAPVMPSIHEAAVIELQEGGNRQQVIRTAWFKNHWLQVTLKGTKAALAKGFRVWSVT